MCIIVPVVASLGLLGMGALERQTPTVKTIKNAVRLHAPDARPSCLSFETQACMWPVDHPRGTIFLVGDSEAEQFTEPLAAAAFIAIAS